MPTLEHSTCDLPRATDLTQLEERSNEVSLKNDSISMRRNFMKPLVKILSLIKNKLKKRVLKPTINMKKKQLMNFLQNKKKM